MFIAGSLRAVSFPFALLTPSYFPLPALSLDAEMTYFFPMAQIHPLAFFKGTNRQVQSDLETQLLNLSAGRVHLVYLI